MKFRFLLFQLLFLSGFLFSFSAKAQCPTNAATTIEVCEDAGGNSTIRAIFNDGAAPISFILFDISGPTAVSDPFGPVSLNRLAPNIVEFGNVPDGTYIIRVSCSPTGFTPIGGFGINVSASNALAISGLTIDPDCNPLTGGANADGSISFTINGGKPPYSISWPTGATSISSSSGNTNPFNFSTSGLDGGSYSVSIIDASNCSITQNFAVPVATIPNAGPDQTICNSPTATLAANAAGPGEIGTWTVVSGTGTFANANDPTTTVSGLTIGASSTFRWTLRDSGLICPGNPDDVIIQSDQAPTTALAGSDQTICNTSATLAANAPVIGTGAWSIISGSGGTIASPANPASSFTGTAGSTYVLRWTITNGICPASTDDVQIVMDAAPTTAAAGPDQLLCATSATLAANTQTVGTGAWSILSGTGGTIANPASPTSNFTGVAGQSYNLQWTISNGSCPPSSDNVTIAFEIPPTPAAAGADQALCAITTSLSANTPTVGTGVWSIISGTGGTVVTTSSPTSVFNGTAGVTYVLRWTISNGVCPVSTDDVQVVFDAAPTSANAGTDQALCATSTTLAGNTPVVGTGNWSIISGTGGTITTPSASNSAFTGTQGQTYTLRWTISNGTCTPTSDEVTITFDQAPTVASAGADQTLCNTTTILTANTPTVGTGAWTIISGAGGTISNPALATSGFTGLVGNTYVLRWTISNGTCTPSTDNVQIVFDAAPTTAAAGTDQVLCGTSTTLAANVPVIGTGTWSIVSGTGGTIASINSPTSSFSGTAGVTYVLRWTIANGTCLPSTDDVQVQFDAAPTTAAAGTDQVVCGTSTPLSGNTPTVGTGAWTIISGTGGSFSNASLPGTTFTGVAGQTYTLRWTISNASCPSSSDDVVVEFDEAPTAAVAGADQVLCNNTTNLTGNTPAIGTGSWTIISGTGGTIVTPSSATSVFNGTAGVTYVLRWTISNSVCTPSTDDVQITFDATPTPAAAGPDLAACGTSITLAGNAPVIGTGLWTIVSGTGGTITTPASPASGFTGLAGTVYVLRWTISNGTCSSSTDDVQITLDQSPTASVAGTDQALCNTTTTLAANTPTVGTGIWSIISGTGGTITTPNDPASGFTGTAGVAYVLRWSISNGSCPVSTDDVQITFDAAPTAAAAGTDQTLCGNSATLAGNTASVGTGTWSIVSGTGGTIVTPADPASAFNGVAGNTYVLRWTISNGTCTPSSDDVQVIFEISPTVANAGTDIAICNTTTTLAGNSPTVGTGLWTIVSGSGGAITTPSSPTSGFTGVAGTTYVLRWTISNGTCTPSTDEVQVQFDLAPTIANAGTDLSVCTTTTTLAANTASAGTGTWTIISGTGGTFTDATTAVSDFTGTAGSIYVLRWTITNGTCTTSDDVQVTFEQPVTIAAAGPDKTICGPTTLEANAPTIGIGTWTIITGTGGVLADATSPVSGFTGVAGTAYTLRWTISGTVCTASTDDVVITFDLNSPSVSNAGPDQTICTPTATLAANTPLIGTGTWSIISGTGGTFANAADPATVFTGTPGVAYVLQWSITTGALGCVANTDNVSITFEVAPTTAAAGTDLQVCGTSTTLAANVPASGAGAWSIVSGTGGSFADATNPATSFTGTVGQSYVLSWTITNSCGTSSDNVSVILDPTPAAAIAGSDKTVCGVATLEGNIPSTGTGSWTIITGTGGVIADPTNPVSTFTGTAGVTYTLRWTITNGVCTPSSDDVDITFDINTPTAANAGTDQTPCALSTALNANAPAVGTGTWTIVSGTGGVIADAANPVSNFTGVTGQVYVLEWTITSLCGTSTDQVQIILNDPPTAAAAGTDKTVCGPTTLEGNAPAVGTGSWTVVSGTGGIIADPVNPLSGFSGIAGTVYVLRWTISNGSCTPSTDDVQVTFDTNSPTIANAGSDQAVCATNATLAGNTPTSGTGTWTIINGTGGTLTDATLATSGFTGVTGTTYTLRWSISSGVLGCSDSFDEVTIALESAPTVADAGADQQLCAITTALAGNVPASGTGSWTVVSGSGGVFADASNPVTTFNGVAGQTYQLRWTIATSCSASSDDVTIIFDANPTVAVAGTDKTVCGPTQLEGNLASSGTGLWTIVSGTGGILADATNPVSGFNGIAGTVYTLRWTISNGTCIVSSDDVDVTFDINTPTIANAGADQNACGTTAILAANTPLIGTGTWTIISGTGGTIADPANPVSSFDGVAGSTYVLQWEIASGTAGCAASADQVSIVFETAPTVAAAGADQSFCGTSVSLAANAPASGTGAWTIVSGTGGSITDAALNNSTFTGTVGSTYVLEWTVSNSCGSSADQVTIQFQDTPTIANAGTDQVICGVISTLLSANTPSVGTGIWTIVSGAGGAIITPGSPTSQFVGSAGTSYTLRWIITNGSCTPSTDDVVINFSASPVVTSPVTVCINNAAPVLTVIATGASSFNWYYYTDPSVPASRTFLATTATGNYTPSTELNTASVGSLTYEVTAVYGCGESPASQIVVNVSNTGACGGGTGNCVDVKITPDPSPATCTLSNGSIFFLIDPPVPVVNNVGVVIEVKGVSSNNNTIARTNFNDPQFNGLPIGQYEYTIIYGDAACTKFGLVTIDQSGTVGTPVATGITGPVCSGSASGKLTIDVEGETGNVLEWSVDGLVWTPFVSGAPEGVDGVPAGPAPTFERLISVRRNASDPCNAAVLITMQDANPVITFNITAKNNITECFAEDGSFTVSGITGGTGSYQARILTGGVIVRDFEPVSNNTVTYNSLPAGTYTVEVMDNTNCVVDNSAFPVVLTAPGGVKFDVAVLAGASCESNQGKSGLIRVTFDATQPSGNYLIGVSTSPVTEPAEYASYIYNQGDLNGVQIDTLSRGEYFVFVKPQANNVCPSVKPTGFIDGPFKIDFDIQRICTVSNDGSATINLVNVSGDPASSYNIEVYRVSDLSDKVDDFTSPAVNGIISIDYIPTAADHAWLAQPDDYLIRLYQMNQGTCPGNKPPLTPSSQLTYSVTQPLALVVENIRASYPEPKQTGGFMLRTITGGVPINDGDGPYYLVSVYDPASNSEIIGPLKVYRNPQGNYQYDFRNLPVGNYLLGVTDFIACEVTSLVIVPADTRILIPNIFSPNNDNINDLFEIVNLPATGKHELVITNRWGKQMFSSSEYKEGRFWAADGAPEGIYYYRLKVEGDKVYTGWVEIIRGTKP